MTASRSEPPRTTFARGINPFQGLGALPSAKPEPTMQKPAKPAKTKLKVEDYSTPYQPPVASIAPHGLTIPMSLDDIRIDTDVPLPASGSTTAGRHVLLTSLLAKLQPKESAGLPYPFYATLNKVVSSAHKAGSARYATKKDKAAQTLRVWRVS